MQNMCIFKLAYTQLSGSQHSPIVRHTSEGRGRRTDTVTALTEGGAAGQAAVLALGEGRLFGGG
ncbi:rCG32343 [Rattus norvegicus]|uniref:RCG32343 n=1 Tax=Rattus norvegicus TaxID=10116 RepID=A6JXK3_RAT|nr:rCG32343 [Rattus norvegicus]